MTTDTKALITPIAATVALVRRELDKSREAQRGGMQCGMPKAVKVDCAMVERLCRIAEKQVDRLAALEAELAEFRHGAGVARATMQALEQDNARLREALEGVLGEALTYQLRESDLVVETARAAIAKAKGGDA